MSEKEQSSVKLYISGSGNPTDIKTTDANNAIYHDYVVQQNMSLMEDNRNMSEEVRTLRAQINELEEACDDVDSKARRLKQYVGNFHTISQIYKELAEEDYRYLSKSKDSKGKLQSMIFMIVGLLALLIEFYGYRFLPIIMVLTYYWYVHLAIPSGQAETQRLISLHKSKSADLKGLEKTMDIIGEFIDNAL